jgi:hypothetical protein
MKVPTDLDIMRYQLQLVSVSSSTDIFSGITRFSISQDFISNLWRECQRQTAGSSGSTIKYDLGMAWQLLAVWHYSFASQTPRTPDAAVQVTEADRSRQRRLTASVYRAARAEAFNI